MQPNLENDPNYLVTGVNEFSERGKSIRDVAGVLLGIVAIIATTLLVIKSSKSISFADALYQYYISLIFLAVAAIFYTGTFLWNKAFIPIHYLLNKANQDSIALANPDQDLPTLKGLFGKAQSAYRTSRKRIQYGHAFLVVAVLTEAFVFVVPPHALRTYMLTDPTFAAISLLIIGLLFASLLQMRVFTGKSEQFGFALRFNQKVQLVQNVNPQPIPINPGQQIPIQFSQPPDQPTQWIKIEPVPPPTTEGHPPVSSNQPLASPTDNDTAKSKTPDKQPDSKS